MTDQRLVQRRIASLLLSTLLLVCLGYQAYRYPFQINSALTSPTYSNTPAWLQYGKWALISALAIAIALSTAPSVRATLRGASRARFVALALEVLLVVSALVRIAAGAASVEPWILLVLAGTGLLVTMVPTIDERTGTIVVRIVVGYAVVCVAVEIVQVLLYLLLDRLPALAYADSPSVRFGSVLDDPNGFAVLLALLIPTTWMALRARPNLRLVVGVALLACLPLTQSWTGVTATVVALSVVYLTLRGVKRDARRAAGFVLSAVVVIGVAAFFARSTIAELIRLKRGSAEEHAASFARIAPAPTPVRIPEASSSASASASPSPTASHPSTGLLRPGHVAASADPIATATWSHGIESGWVNLLANYGPVVLGAFLALGVLAAAALLRGRTGLPLALRAGGAAYLICFLLAAANLGLDRTFPCNVLYFVLCGLALAASIPRTSRRRGRGEARGHAFQPGEAAADPLLVHARAVAAENEPPRDARELDEPRTRHPLVLLRQGRGGRPWALGRKGSHEGPLQAAPLRIEGTR